MRILRTFKGPFSLSAAHIMKPDNIIRTLDERTDKMAGGKKDRAKHFASIKVSWLRHYNDFHYPIYYIQSYKVYFCYCMALLTGITSVSYF